MTKQQVVEYFGSVRAACEAIKISKGAFSQWGEEVPLLRQYQFQGLTKGALTVASEIKN